MTRAPSCHVEVIESVIEKYLELKIKHPTSPKKTLREFAAKIVYANLLADSIRIKRAIFGGAQ